jgi:hypothetical protein
MIMRRDWIFGLGAISTLTVLVALDLFVALALEPAVVRHRHRAKGNSPKPA